ncbi:hypothetical protein E2C01_073100 [Portunus trituberculatus]|uniref:Uncharacterized protein n=1 Tax=Portunus trituberculatus TaxID=210409 RepID=A0A5B7I9P0_PORTR|nr:hypothetical protein [Portunus trituberculatus]
MGEETSRSQKDRMVMHIFGAKSAPGRPNMISVIIRRLRQNGVGRTAFLEGEATAARLLVAAHGRWLLDGVHEVTAA